MKHVQTARRELKLRAIFNLLGPLTNLPNASAQVVGVYSVEKKPAEKLAEAKSTPGISDAFLWSTGGLDEGTATGPTLSPEVRDSEVHTYEVTPEEFGPPRARLEDKWR